MNRFDNIDCMIGMAEYEDNHFDLCICDPPFYNTFWFASVFWGVVAIIIAVASIL